MLIFCPFVFLMVPAIICSKLKQIISKKGELKMMQQLDYWSYFWTYLYENWFVFFAVMLSIIVIMTLFVVRIVATRIQTKVFYFQKNSIDEYKAKEKGGLIWFDKKSVERKKDPYIRKKGWRVQRIFIVQENRKTTLDFRHVKLDPSKDKIMWEAVIESQAITQSIRGLLETRRMILIYLCAGAGIGFLISQVIFAMG